MYPSLHLKASNARIQSSSSSLRLAMDMLLGFGMDASCSIPTTHASAKASLVIKKDPITSSLKVASDAQWPARKQERLRKTWIGRATHHHYLLLPFHR